MLKVFIPGKTPKILLAAFTAMAMIIIVMGALAYVSIENDVRLEAYNKLSDLASLKIREVTNWRHERLNDASFVFHNDMIKRLTLEFLKNPADTVKKGRITDFIRTLKNNHEYPDIVILDSLGNQYPLFTKDETKLPDSDKVVFKKCIEERKVLLSDIYLYESRNGKKIQMGSFIPLFLSESKKVFCVVEIKIDPIQILFPSIQPSSSSSKTSESFIVRKDGDSVLFLNNLKHIDNSALNYRLPLNKTDLPAAMAVLGKEGIFEGKDYRGEPVLADLQKIPDSPWFLVAKIDKDELYSSLEEKAIIITGFVVMLVLLCGLIAYTIWKQQQLKFLDQKMKSELDNKLLQERIDYLVKTANDIILLSDDYNRILKANDKALLTYGYSMQEISSLSIADLRSDMARKDIEKDKQRIKDNNGYIFESTHVKKDGTEFPVEISSSIIEIDGRKFYQSFIRDITERKIYEDKLKNTIEELDRSNKDLEQFAYVASHDLQEPLRMVHTYAQLIEKKYKNELDANAHEYFQYLTEGAQRMHQLILALLEYARVNSDKSNFKSVNLNEIVENVLNNLDLKIKESQAKVTYNSLPTIMADGFQMTQLFQNLISNAINYKCGNSPMILIKAESNKDGWIFSVKDNGIGISKEYFDKIFVIFQRLHEREKYPGIGIGLTICKKIVEHHGGKIWVESIPGDGATFYFTIPNR